MLFVLFSFPLGERVRSLLLSFSLSTHAAGRECDWRKYLYEFVYGRNLFMIMTPNINL